MKKLMFCAVFAALVAAPAIAQPDHHRGGGPQGGTPHAAPSHNNPGPSRPAPGAPLAAAPAPQAQARPQGGNGGNWHGNNNRPGSNAGNHTRPTPGSSNNRPGNNNWQGNNNRPGSNAGNHTRPSPGFNNNRPRRDYSSFRNYHQNFRSGRRFHAPSYHRPSGWYYRRWTFGQILPSLFWAQQYWLNDYGVYDLPPPPYGAVWVRYGNDALLIDRDTGEIITVEYDVFY
jgi:Ni/Co efflux regulator RcnB